MSQLVILQALQGFAAGGLIPSLSSLMNLWAPTGNQGAIYGLDTSVNAAARSLAPMLGAAATAWFGLRGVFGATTVVYTDCSLTVKCCANAPSPSRLTRGKGCRR